MAQNATFAIWTHCFTNIPTMINQINMKKFYQLHVNTMKMKDWKYKPKNFFPANSNRFGLFSLILVAYSQAFFLIDPDIFYVSWTALRSLIISPFSPFF